MSATFKQNGELIDYTNPSSSVGLDYGAVVDLDTRIGIVTADIAASGTGTLAVTGVYELPAINTAAFTLGQEVYWNGTALTGNGANLTPAGWCVAAKAETATVVSIKLIG